MSNLTVASSERRNQVLKKHVGTIHSSNNISLLQRKIANALLHHAYHDLLTKDFHEIHISQLCKLIGYRGHNQRVIKDALVSLISTVIEWNLVDKKKPGSNQWNASSIIADASIEGPLCTYSYSRKMRELLHKPEIYGLIDMQLQSQFTSSYGLALYENCSRFRKINQTPWFDVATFRMLMGIADSKYKRFSDLKKAVIDIALSEVNRLTSMVVTLEMKKVGRKITSLKFYINEKKIGRAIVDKATSTDNCSDLSLKLVQAYGFTHKQASGILEQYEETYVKEKMRIIESSAPFREGKIFHLPNYFRKALEDDFQVNNSSNATHHVQQDYEKEQRRQEQIREFSSNYRDYLFEVVIENYDQLVTDKRKDILKVFEERVALTLLEKTYREEGLKNILVRDRFCEYLLQEHGALAENAMSFEQFIYSSATANAEH